ncbi:PadR family transcriptional regulator [Aquibacillus halophilus]|uniref:PadR family transcriptional regulator n=1 Tax=Aquibacillus halophilus TaxID=930132 RepID=A0A6A8DSE7_9BACI|nr:PadR family transcriptional regulator [Aquibacillus halophilus]MRH44152.1 PadR family transcriptional regulator [Aquibacillus halophilus]
MEDRLKNLRHSMDKTKFNQLNFSDQLRKKIHKRIEKQNESKESIYLAVLQLLANKKTGYDLTKLLRSRGIQFFEEDEGNLFTMLHSFEQNGYLLSNWDENGAKHYQISRRGKNLLQQSEKNEMQKRLVVKQLLER